ncbi:MAG: hypothetical protein ACUZ8I_13910 [Candidatus Scalindua sp.]
MLYPNLATRIIHAISLYIPEWFKAKAMSYIKPLEQKGSNGFAIDFG